MARVKDIVSLLNNVAPETNVLKDEYDNVGLLVGRADAEVKRVLCCLVATEEVISEAGELGVQLIVAHHPMIYAPVKSVTDNDVTGRKILAAIERGIAVYAAHTNLDFSGGGINDFTAQLLGLLDVSVMQPYISDHEGLGRVGNLSGKMYAAVLKGQVENLFKDKYVRIIGEPYEYVSRVAIINGGGGGSTDYVDMALKSGADCLITADVKHHVAVYAKENGLTVIEPQHYTMEHCYITRLVQILKLEALSAKLDVEIIQSSKDINPRF